MPLEVQDFARTHERARDAGVKRIAGIVSLVVALVAMRGATPTLGRPATLATHVAPSEAQLTKDIVMEQVSAYAKRDIDRFIAMHAPNVRQYLFPGTVTHDGAESLRTSYQALFAGNPELGMTIKGMISIGNYAFVRERVTGLRGLGSVDAIAIYEVTDRKISRVWLIP